MPYEKEEILMPDNSQFAIKSAGYPVAIENLAESVHSLAKNNGFWKEGEERNEIQMLFLMITELVECGERIRSKEPNKEDEHCPGFSNKVIELADCVIRILDMARGLKLPIGEAIIAKHNYNCTRPYKHGKQF